jgi:pimeloyl-ACP methyl ester carboxylesterase
LSGDLIIPRQAGAIVIFSHGSGSSRHSPRNQFVARALNDRGIATLLVDLLTEREDQDYARRFDIKLLTNRLIAVTRYVKSMKESRALPIGYFGASTGAASALRAAAQLAESIPTVVVSRGGRPDLAEDALDRVTSPTLLLVGALDKDVLELNQYAYSKLQCEKELKVIPGAGHLFEEPGKLKEVAFLAAEWFHAHLMIHTPTP